MHPHPKILVIEDNNELRTLFRAILKRQHLSMVEADDGAEGLVLAHEHKPLMILCDVHLKNSNGYEVLRQLKADPETNAIPVVMVSGAHDDGAALAAGADAFLSKPFTATEFLSLIRETLGSPA
ncbi:MAG TPA: response regulator [Candidatus Acidoferrum sp.]|nr:response regulator [Candidatus Acidoferrum sp.]